MQSTYEYVERQNGSSQYDESSLIGYNMHAARYVKSSLSFDNGNPFIEALPRPRMDMTEISAAYQRNILLSSIERRKEMPFYYKLAEINLLRQVRFPLTFHRELEEQMYLALLNSYRNRHIRFVGDDSILEGNEGAGTNAGFSLLGYSGCGKSSALEILLSNYPQVIVHDGNTTGKFTQIVYLVVSCLANSSFRAMYDSIGTAIDKALGISNNLYRKYISSGRTLGEKSDRIRELVEKFGIGCIIFDEIQLIDFASTKENSFESLLTLANKTKVAVVAVGTEDAYDKMFNAKLRTGRRLGPTISGHAYCENREYVNYLLSQLFKYYWTDEPIPLTEEIQDTFYEVSRGIVDQIIGIYIFLQVELIKDNTIKVNSAFIKRVVNKYYPGLQKLLGDLQNPLDEAERIRILREGNNRFEDMLSNEKQKMNASEIMKYMEDSETKKKNELRDELVSEISDYMDEYSVENIINAVNAELNSKCNAEAGKSELRKKVIQRLKKISDTKSNNQKKEKKEKGSLLINMKKDVLS